MAKAKRVRWDCPNGLHPGELGSTRPPANATVRFCWPCSLERGRLVERVAPALERQRNARQRASEAKRERAAEREQRIRREQRERRYLVTVLDYTGGTIEIDVGRLLREAWATQELRERRAGLGPAWRKVPELTVRRGAVPMSERQRHQNRDLHPSRERDGISGHAKTGYHEIVLTVGPDCGREWLEAIVVHEAAHQACEVDAAHKAPWRNSYLRAVRELYGVTVANAGAAWRLDEMVATAIRERGGV